MVQLQVTFPHRSPHTVRMKSDFPFPWFSLAPSHNFQSFPFILSFKNTLSPAILFLGIYQKSWKLVPKQILYTHIHSSTSYNQQKVDTTHMSVNWWMCKENVAYPFNGILFNLKKNEVLKHATTWMDLRNMLLHERSQIQKALYCMIPFIWKLQNGKSIETEGRWVIARGWGERGMERLMGYEVSSSSDETVLEGERSSGCTTLWMR